MMIIPSLFINPSINWMLILFTYGAVIGLVMQIYSDRKIRQLQPNAKEEDFSTHQTQLSFLLCDYQKAFDLCLESIEFLKNGNVKTTNFENGLIEAQTGMTWKSFGTVIQLKLKQLTETSTEIEITAKPLVKTTLIDYGETLETVNTLIEFFKSKNEELNYNLLESKIEIPIDFYKSATDSVATPKI